MLLCSAGVTNQPSIEPSVKPAYVEYKRHTIPKIAYSYKSIIIIASKKHFGHKQYISLLAAQIHQESYWKHDAVSWAGATGLTQFMPRTWEGESKRCGLDGRSPLNPKYAIFAQSCYMSYLERRNYEFMKGCERYAATLSAYNGGQGNVNRQRRKWAREAWMSADSSVHWFGFVENYRVRSKSAHKENRDYPRRILMEITPNYVYNGFGGIDICKSIRNEI